MAKPAKFRTHEALNLDAAAMWKQSTAQSVTDTTKIVTVWKNDGTGTQYHTVHLMTTEDIYFMFSDQGTDKIVTAKDLYLKGGDNIHSLKIPHGLAGGPGTSITLQMQRVTATGTVRYVLA